VSAASLDRDASGRWRLRGEVLPSDAVAIRQQGEAWLASSPTTIVVDLAGLSRATSVVLSILLCWMRAAETAGKALSIEGWPPALEDIARVSGIDTVLASRS
jgi:phospholipid transport system transporter-binding protein